MQITIEQDIEKKLVSLAQILDQSVSQIANKVLRKACANLSELMSNHYADTPPTTNGPVVGADGFRLADRIRAHAAKQRIIPARKSGMAEVTIKAGDIHRDLSLRNRLPAVCAALGSTLFAKLAGAQLLRVSGPANGATTEFTFKL